MSKKLRNYFHSPRSFLADGIFEKTTWVGIVLLIFGAIFKNDIYSLIHNILNDHKTTDLLITAFPAIIAFALAWLKEK